ncbi:MAG: efflux RND transporter periplasmic adaptor subunit [Candidatus Rokubacteria bacterium]|nr:efflux RND transporter periplasmic adaptor subunit [Candidatus Rokubacteria bacterium]
MPATYRLLAVLLTLALLAGCGQDGGSPASATATPGPPPAVTVTVAPVEARDVARTVETTGSLLAWEEAALASTVPGTVTRLLVDLGDRVEPGQVLAELDRRELDLAVRQAEAAVQGARDGLVRARAQAAGSQANLAQVRESRRTSEANVNRWKAALDEAQLNLERSKRLVDEQLVAQRDLDAARTQYESMRAQHEAARVEMGQYPDRVRVAEAQLQSDVAAVQVAEAEVSRRDAELGLTRKRLGDATLRAPIRGAIARRHVNRGESLRDSAVVFTIVRTDPLKFSGVVPEHAALEVRPGQTVELTVEPVPGRTFTGRVTRVSPAVDVANRTVLLEAEVRNPDAWLKPGLFARGTVATGRDTGVAFVPEAAVSSVAGVAKVFVVADGRAHERGVRPGRRQGGAVEIVEGARVGEQVATSSLGKLFEGAAVAVSPRGTR